MTRRIILAGLLLLLLWLAGKPTPPAAIAQSPAYEVIQLVNNFRVANGLPAFQINQSLMIAAQQQADYMAASNIYSHTGAGGSSPQSRAEAAGYVGWVSENIVGGTNLTPQKGLIWWQNSAVHYAALVSTRHTEVGAGFAVGFDQNFYALVVGQPSNAPAAAAASPSNNNQPAPIQVAPFTPAQPGEDGSIVHTVQQGQALWTLAAHYEVPLADLLLFNGLSENAIVNPGDKIIIRLGEGQSPPPTPAPPTTHIVGEGQTLWYIANLHQVEISNLLWYNGITMETILQPGQEITIRLAEGQAPPPTPTPQLTHIIEPGDTLWSVALIHHISLEQLMSWNNLAENALLSIGQELLIRQPPTEAPTNTPEAVAVAPTVTPSPPNQPIANSQPVATMNPTEATPTAAATQSPPSTLVPSTPAPARDWGTLVGIAILVIVGIAFFFLQRQ